MTKLRQDDQTEQGEALTPAFITAGEPATDLPAFRDVANVRSLYGWQPGETLEEAIARCRKDFSST
jgi:nucleoside-diphosphate-sugar epimerase